MSDSGENITPIDNARDLRDAVREVKNAFADRDDVVVELREASKVRLELLAQELEPVFKQVPAEEPHFDFAVSSGLQPRLWIDATAHVEMGRDKRSYRFVRDTRLGRVVLAESHDIKPVADQVTVYIAERMVERQRLLEEAPLDLLQREIAVSKKAVPTAVPARRGKSRQETVMANLVWFILGALGGMFALMLWMWDRLAGIPG